MEKSPLSVFSSPRPMSAGGVKAWACLLYTSRPESEKPVVLCANHDRGALTRKACTAGCIGCMKCEKSCPEDAIHVHNNVARVDYDKCTGCRTCMNVCPCLLYTSREQKRHRHIPLVFHIKIHR